MNLTRLTIFFVMTCFCSAQAAQAERPSHINEQFFEPLTEANYSSSHPRYVDDECRGSAEVWHKILLGMDIESSPPETRYYFNGCGAATAISTLEEIRRQLGKDHPYQKIWAQNQQRVLSGKSNNAEAPVKPSGENLPSRAMSDYEYQLASWHFYKGEYDEALVLYQKVAGELNAPMRPYAAYMVMRTLYRQSDVTGAEQQIRDILADDSLKPVHDIASNYRFVMLWGRYEGNYDAAFMQDMLPWLLEVIKISPEKAIEINHSLNDFGDAKWHLNHYFPLYDQKSKAVDWWLREDVEVSSPRMQAVKNMASSNETVDWLQSTWALNIFDADWLWALHRADADYWRQNQNIVNHAWNRWLAGDGLEWLEIVMARIHPDSPIAPKALKAAKPYFAKDWKNETHDYRLWLADIWQNAIRLHLGRKEYAQARSLIVEHPDYDALRINDSYKPDRRHAELLEKSLRWLVYVGEWEEARTTLAVILRQYPNDFKHWRTLLATDWDEAMVSVYKLGHNYSNWSPSYDVLWQRMANFLPAEKLYALAQDKKIREKMRAVLVNTALTRAMLLGQDDKVKTYAVLAAKLNPSMRERIFRAVELSKHDGYIDLMLRIPRMRPTPFAMPANLLPHGNSEIDPAAIDTYNHNDNNWWCRYDVKKLDDKLGDAALVTLETNRAHYKARWIFRGIRSMIPSAEETVQASEAPYIKKQLEQLAKHPFHALVNEAELKALEAIPSGSQYLSEAVIDREKWKRWMFWRSEKAQNKSASDLHHAVRTTRYGCQKNGSHAVYSRAAFEILHKGYGDTVWAEATPYWFSCKHFKDGCAKAE
ncbi:MAG: tetratricopeptide repeat protein [Alphaproteobacteria bacterium]|nr:tetratricopeptide repeat protein [Alphaproteobacteria bacterium]